jgi:hypothetical protein
MATSLRAYLVVAAIVVWAGLLLQLDVSTMLLAKQGRPISYTVFRMLGYFTILTNLIVASYYTVRLFDYPLRVAAWLTKPPVGSAIALYISFVAFIFAVLLQHLTDLSGPAWVADTILHYVTPALFVIYWAVFIPKRSLRWIHALVWAAYPLAYVIYALIRGGLSGFYPYPFIDASVLGLPQVLLNTLALLVIFCFAGLLVILIDRHWPVGRSQGTTTAMPNS